VPVGDISAIGYRCCLFAVRVREHSRVEKRAGGRLKSHIFYKFYAVRTLAEVS